MKNRTKSSLQTLIKPTTIQKFVQEYFEKEILFIKRNQKNYFSDLFSIHDLESLITLTGKSSSYHELRIAKAEGFKFITKQLNFNDKGTVDIYSVYRSYDEGYTIIANRIDHKWKPLAEFCRSLETEFHHPVGVNLYFTPKGAQGLSPHFDTHDVFVLQLEGTKEWKIYDSNIVLPLIEQKFKIRKEKLGKVKRTLCLKSGDLLYLPRGVVHEATASMEPSLHLTIGIHVLRWIDFVNIVLTKTEEPWGSKTMSKYKLAPKGLDFYQEILEPYEKMFPRTKVEEDE